MPFEFGFKNCRSFFASVFCFIQGASVFFFTRCYVYRATAGHIRKCSNACNPSILMTGHIFYPIFFLFSLLDWMVIHIFADTTTGFVGFGRECGWGWRESEALFYDPFAWKTSFFFPCSLSPLVLLRAHVAAVFRGISYKILNECNQNYCVH